ncbi:peptide-methionine (R)-S-oxide reductase MsrB [Tenacibaculum finnmarkense genomovar finnmarkense]|uniref:Multifunctional fusion protein n=1 Tax=Tenacibaculum dicentrarchi TaxID=669041 RepID=A0ABM9NWI6_9FLAO|nr:peptide-methionine (R)-S-oxide reductase MsrB [Tenacibaculum finnmarkense genomovar finnmarkense]MCG8711530.1 peptide-methionine (R)-S-oxide reductase MsrB [Tenacibaculum finnmarkense]MCG8828034.1 peptide-methionine (R)-S-oxide reductase MsrB [Tenacibaculum dicentrarchi]MCG8185452.1 peptide-methionine (R)-S-oxide reductase MsrB [Tenacibaculum finnmarkense genomovar finnmarkense]MCG8201836.1 peptide-methionine (R)-S-oxide reductase MsrB [Tenacibaculum finnmarkense genomovar finnmarkense]
MKKINFLMFLFAFTVITQCLNAQVSEKIMIKNKEIYLAGGCFWGIEHFLQQIGGVINTEVGYANGKIINPTYKIISTTETGFVETVKVEYNPAQITLKKLLKLFFKIIDPTKLNQQGNDIGTQYRTGIYYTEKIDEAIVKLTLNELTKLYDNPIVVESNILQNYYRAEQYHQKYLDKNPSGYCHIPKFFFQMAKEANRISDSNNQIYKKQSDTALKNKLSNLQYEVTQKNATEVPFKNEYWNEFREGIYVDITTGEPLFISTDKFESGCGWPSFSKPLSKSSVYEKTDKTLGMLRTEIRSKTGNSHLGHVFNDGPADKGGLRYCINSASLRFISKEEMKRGKYKKFLYLLDK